jgi:hypothetical protein
VGARAVGQLLEVALWLRGPGPFQSVWPGENNQAGLEDRPDCERRMNNADWRKPYTTWRLRSIRSVLAPNGSSNNVPAPPPPIGSVTLVCPSERTN